MEVANRFYAVETLGDMEDIENFTASPRGYQESSNQETNQKRARGEKLSTNQEEQKNRWKEHFAELLNRPPPDNPPNIGQAEVDLEIYLEPPNTGENLGALKKTYETTCRHDQMEYQGMP
ncbi:hypothetical protein ElyMa_006492100 [Elysia marginata]|uniref:Uncharacterized protein n=1 Tax=Elysia marginata TaxID=1093978 RepID=A0AAV4I1K8_9GAST|nr:hypothetical protein ElyMa_006492100 [Elysia marginata]